MELFVVFLADIQKTLRLKKRVNSKEFLNKFYWDKNYFDLFIKIDNEGLFPLKKPEIDYKIKLKKINKRDIEIL